MVGISLLTLVPGQLGGSETYVRELLRGLGRVGELSYRVLLPPVAPGAAEGLPAETADEYRTARTVPQRLLAMMAATARPGPLRRRLRGADVVHYPLTLRIPPLSPSVVTLHDLPADVEPQAEPGNLSLGAFAVRPKGWNMLSAPPAGRPMPVSRTARHWPH